MSCSAVRTLFVNMHTCSTSACCKDVCPLHAQAFPAQVLLAHALLPHGFASTCFAGTCFKGTCCMVSCQALGIHRPYKLYSVCLCSNRVQKLLQGLYILAVKPARLKERLEALMCVRCTCQGTCQGIARCTLLDPHADNPQAKHNSSTAAMQK